MLQKISNYTITSFSDLIGQEELFQENSILANLLKHRILENLIFYGKTGSGKTTIINLLVNEFKADLDVLDFNPLMDKKEALTDFINNPELTKTKLVIINEIHNMNKDKQDILLKALETQSIYLFASTNFNPQYNLQNALLSRCLIIQTKEVTPAVLKAGLMKIIAQKQQAEKKELTVHDYTHVIDLIVDALNTDIRKAIHLLLLIYELYNQQATWNMELITTFIHNNISSTSLKSDEFKDLKSAFHKSMRGSEVDASLYYLGLLMKTQDYNSIYRRIICAAYEDVGLANPQVCAHATLAVQACEYLGPSESFDVLSMIVCEIALSPKSNSAYKALSKVDELISAQQIYDIPPYLKNTSYTTGINYKYPHDYVNHYVSQQYLPDELKTQKFYFNGGSSNEQALHKYWSEVKKIAERQEK